MRLKLTLVALAALGTFFACKPQGDSETKALDNFAGGTDVHKCGGKYKSRLPNGALNDPGDLRDEVEAALSSVPEGIQDLYFKTMRGRISVTKDAGAICSGVANAGKTVAAVTSCWKAVGGAPVIFINATAQDVRHSLVRGFGYYVSEEWFHGKDLYPDKRRIGQALLSDVASSTKYDLYEFRKMLDALVLEKGINDAERNKRLDGLPPPVHSVARDVFYDYAFAETFDSYYCNSGTRYTLAKGKVFQRTGAVFKELKDDLEALNADSVQGAVKLTDDGSLGLTGDAGAGEGLNLFGRFRTGSIIGNIRERRNAGYGVFQQNGPLRRAWRGTVDGSSQFSTTSQINYTGNRTQTFQVAGGNYERQPDGSYGWVPTGSPTGFKPTYFATAQSNGTWSYSGEVAPKPQTSPTVQNQSFAGTPVPGSTLPPGFGGGTGSGSGTGVGSGTGKPQGVGTGSGAGSGTGTGPGSGTGAAAQAGQNAAVQAAQSAAANVPTQGTTSSTVPPTTVNNPNTASVPPAANNPATTNKPPVSNTPATTGNPPVTNTPAANTPVATANPSVTNTPANTQQPAVTPTPNPLVNNQPLPSLTNLNPNQFAPGSGNNQIEGGGTQEPAAQPQVQPTNPNPFGPNSGNNKELKDAVDVQSFGGEGPAEDQLQEQ